MILVAFSRDAKIGVDIQEIIDCSEYLEIARSFFEPEEVKISRRVIAKNYFSILVSERSLFKSDRCRTT